MKIILLLLGLALFSYPFIADISNPFIAIPCIFAGVICFRAMRGRQRLEYVGSRTQHFFRRK